MKRKRKGSILGAIAGGIMNLFCRSSRSRPVDLQKADFPTSTQKMGVRFTDKIRDKFRKRWIKKR